jgi:hypothetical protein
MMRHRFVKASHNGGMQISDEAVDELIKLYKEEFNEDITRSQASEMAFRLVTLYELLSQKLPNRQEITLPDQVPSSQDSRPSF